MDTELDYAIGMRMHELMEMALTLCGIGIHDKGWSLEEATEFLLENTFAEEEQAAKAVNRVLLHPGSRAGAYHAEIKISRNLALLSLL